MEEKAKQISKHFCDFNQASEKREVQGKDAKGFVDELNKFDAVAQRPREVARQNCGSFQGLVQNWCTMIPQSVQLHTVFI